MAIDTEKREGNLVRVLIVVALIALGVIAVAVLGKILADAVAQSAPATTVQAGIPVTVEVNEGASARTIGSAMEAAGVVSQRDLVRLVEQEGIAAQLKPGTYHLETGMTPEVVAARLVSGPDLAGESVIVLEGVTIAAALESLAEQTDYTVEDFEEPLRSRRVISPYLPSTPPEGVDELTAWEGLLYPARYQIDDDATPREILQLMADEMVHRMGDVDWSRLEELGLSRYEALIVASLIEREAGIDEDRPLISSVIHNRLGLGMPLQIDATVVYVRGTPGHVLAEHLEIDSPWNTYQIVGLPPTPISTIRMESLDAAVDPTDTEYLYYVLVSADGSHGFSTTYEEHQAKVEQAKADGIFP